MKNLFKKIVELYHSHNIDFFVSLVGPLVMGTIHLVSICLHYDWIVLNYCIFFYLMALIKVLLWSFEKCGKESKEYIIGAISTAVLILPMMASMVMTILYKNTSNHLFDWFVYLYAFYGTIKLIFAIRNLVISKRGTTKRGFVLAWIGLVAALYTIQMMEFKLIMFASSNENSAMYLVQLFTQGAIFIFSIFVLVLFAVKHSKSQV